MKHTVHLWPPVAKSLESQARKKQMSLKVYIEWLLTNQAKKKTKNEVSESLQDDAA